MANVNDFKKGGLKIGAARFGAGMEPYNLVSALSDACKRQGFAFQSGAPKDGSAR